MSRNFCAIDRRQWTGGLLASSASLALASQGATRLLAADGKAPLQRFPRVMQEFLVQQVRAAHQRSLDAQAALKTHADAEAYVSSVRERIAESFGPQPERTPLNARVTGVLDRDGYTIEKVIFESRPNFPVTANLYLPKSSSPVPGVVGTCGHSVNGKAAEAYQSFSQGLARLGYACLIFDPIGQGERLQYADENLRSQVGVGVREHIHAGNQQILVGENFPMWRAWDGIRALDYLLTRPEIDPQHVGVTGNSGGGTMTTWLCGVEPRWTMAAPACFVTTFLRNAENELPADTEQCPLNALALGLEHEDFLIAMAPKPIVILAKERDFFDVRGAEEAYGRIRKVYELLGKPENIRLHIGPTDHGYSIENREAMYGCFNQITQVSDSSREPEIKLEADEALYCTESGQVGELKPTTVFGFTRQRASQLAAERAAVAPEQLPGLVREVLQLPAALPASPPHARILRDFGKRDYPQPYATAYAIETEPNVLALSYLLSPERHLARPRRQGKKAILYVPHRSSDQELRESLWLREQLEDAEVPVFTCDVRGIGESLPNTCGTNTFDDSYGCDYFYAVHGLMLGRPYLGQKVWDVLRTLQWMEVYGYEEVELVGQGWGALIATFVAVLSEQVQGLRIHDRPPAFTKIAMEEHYEMPLAYLLPGVLESFDLSDCDHALRSKLRS
ncbi:alpha/beta hydrolase family protein [Aureliella helgolandensis]|uniref:Alpha/beta hydrolase family protein n=1 Tax=Aureliella helgolandensis TaxID=2527968 RepID=A0A518GCM8_9BACT|nr:acetylxylan esterase [Aureliella helgolandensis]QDV26310.1 Alpha/beta hydrolase family protein [Aureliella helgolandensis]